MNNLRRFAGAFLLSATLGISGCSTIHKETTSFTESILTQQQAARNRPNACPLDDCHGSGG